MKYIAYTDGATSKNGYEGAYGAAAFVLLNDNEEKIYGWAEPIKPATNNICEMTAILKACEYAEKLPDFEFITIYSDSALCINTYAHNWWRGWINRGWFNTAGKPVKNRQLWEALIPYFIDKRFTFKKVKGHTGKNDWNDYVDKLAVSAKEQFNKETNG